MGVLKRIIEVEEITINEKRFYKALGCNTLFFDEKGLHAITKPLVDIEPVRPETYKPLNCKFVVVDNDNCEDFTVGKIYEVKDGKFFDDSGKGLLPICFTLRKFEDLETYLYGAANDQFYSLNHIKILEIKD